MVEYLIEIFEWANNNGLKYYHLADSKTFKSNKSIEDRIYYKNNKQIIVTKLNSNEN